MTASKTGKKLIEAALPGVNYRIGDLFRAIGD